MQEERKHLVSVWTDLLAEPHASSARARSKLRGVQDQLQALKASLSGKSSELEELAKKSAAEKARLVPRGGDSEAIRRSID